MQPLPTPNDRPHIIDLVMQDLRDRKALGIARYNTPLQPFNGRDSLQDAYEEAMDEIFYIKQAILEKEELIKCLEKLHIVIAGLKSPEKGEIAENVFLLIQSLKKNTAISARNFFNQNLE